MKENFISQNNFFYENLEEDNNSLFQFNCNSLFQKEDSSSNYFNNFGELNGEEEHSNNTIDNNINNYQNNNFENDFQYKNIEFPDNENNLNKDFSLMSPIPVHDEDSYKILNNNNFYNNENSKEEVIYKDGNSSGIGSDDTPLSTGGTGLKNHSKENSLNNSNIIKNTNIKVNNNAITFTNEIINDKKQNEKNGDQTVLSKKRKQRIHLEDLNIDPEIIKYKKYQTIGDKVITSKNSVITDLDKKEIRAIRNRISAQKSRDRKKAEFLNLQLQLKYYQQQIERQNFIIKNFEKITCSECKSKLNEIILESNKFNTPLDQFDLPNEKEYLVLDENSSILSDKKNSILGKISGALIAIVCLIGIILCVSQGGFSFPNKNIVIQNNDNQINLRHLETTNENLETTNEIDIEEEENNTNLIIKDEDLDLNVLMPIKSNRLDNLNNLQLYHDRFGLDIYSFLKKKRKVKNGFLMKKPFYNDSILDNSMCIETKHIEHNNYIIDNNFKNTLPIEANNIVLDNKLSHKIISLFVKDYDTLQRFIDGRSLSLQEQIEIEAKNSEDGCVYLQMIIPKYKIDNYGSNDTYTTYEEDGFFEIRGKIFAYNNYYASKVATSF